MTKKYFFLVTVVLSFLFVSCKKNIMLPPDPIRYKLADIRYLKSKANQFSEEYDKYDPIHFDYALTKSDTVFVVSDTLTDYSEFRCPSLEGVDLRVSKIPVPYYVNLHGEAFMSNSFFPFSLNEVVNVKSDLNGKMYRLIPNRKPQTAFTHIRRVRLKVEFEATIFDSKTNERKVYKGVWYGSKVTDKYITFE